MNKNARRYLILLPRQLGDILLGTTLPQAIKQHDPTAHIAWYCHPMGKQLLECNSSLSQVLYYPLPPKSVGVFAFLKYFWAEVVFIFLLRKNRFDVVIDAMNNPRTALTSWLTGAPVRISFSTRWVRNLAFTHLVDRRELSKGYLANSRLKLLQPLGYYLPNVDLLASGFEVRIVLEAHPAEKAKMAAYYQKVLSSTGAHRALLLSATSRQPTRRWPGESFVELGLRWVQKYRETIIWLWGPGEFEFVQTLHVQLQKKLEALGISANFSQLPELFSLRESAVLSGLAAGWVGNSNGLAHVAAAGGGKTIQIHGPTRPGSWTPPQRDKHRGVQRSIGCVECEKNTCALARRECMLDLSVEIVLEHATEVCGSTPTLGA